MVFLRLRLKFKGTPKWMRKFVYRLYTAPLNFTIMVVLLVLGHLMVE